MNHDVIKPDPYKLAMHKVMDCIGVIGEAFNVHLRLDPEDRDYGLYVFFTCLRRMLNELEDEAKKLPSDY